MKHASKTICFLLLMVCSTLSLGMKRIVQTAATKTSPSLYNRIQQKFTELKKVGSKFWNNLTTRYFKAPAIAMPSMDFHQQPLAQPVTPALAQGALKQPYDIAQEIRPVIKAIELSKEKLTKTKETSLIVCTPPGIEIDYISALQSFNDIKDFISKLKIQILRKAGLSIEEASDILWQLTRDQKYIYEHAYATPKRSAIHDATLDPNILQEISIMLSQAGINPLCVTILNKPQKEMGGAFAMASAPVKIKELLIGQPTLIFSQELLNNISRENIAFVIAHEIGHLILCHNNAGYWMKKHFTEKLNKKNSFDTFEEQKEILGNNRAITTDPYHVSKEIDKKVHVALNRIKTLFELEADITYSLYDKNVAETSLRSVQAIISSGRHDTETMTSDIHQSSNMRYHWLKRIRDVHKVQKTKE